MLDFHALLRRAPAVAEVFRLEWVRAFWFQHAQVDRHLLVSGRVRGAVHVGTGQAVYRLLDRVHGHVELLTLHTVCDQNAGADHAPL